VRAYCVRIGVTSVERSKAYTGISYALLCVRVIYF